MQWTSILTKEKFSFRGNLAQRREGTYSCVEIYSKKLIKILALPIARPVCSTTLRRVMELAHLSDFCRQRLDFRSRLHVPYGLSSFLGAFIEQTLVSTNISLGGKLSRLLRFFSLSSLLSSLSFFLSQSKWKLHLSSSLCTIQTCFIDYRTLQLQLEHVSILSLKSSVSTTSILVYHYTCTRLVSNFSLSLSLRTLSRWPEFRQVYRENMLLFDSLFFGIKVRNWVGSMNESQGLRVKEEVFKVYN